MDYPLEAKETISALEALRAQYKIAITNDNPGDQIEEIKNQIMAHRGYLVKWINAYGKQHSTSTAEVESRKSKAYKELIGDDSVTKSGRIDHIRYMFKAEDAELDLLKVLVDNMKRWDRLYQDMVINIQSSLSNIRTERRVEGI